MQRAALRNAEPMSLQRGVAAAGFGSSLRTGRTGGQYLEAGVVRDVVINVGINVANGCAAGSKFWVLQGDSLVTYSHPAGNADLA